ncbi:MAG TPA: radical SAM protein [bacterium]|nr:radical SAM protein [bacterium]
MLKINEIKATSIISKSNLPDSDYVINPYVGCNHACLYCYARFMKRFTGHDEPWGEFVDVKINAPDLIPSNTLKYRGKSIFIASVTDPYLPLERKYQLTRRVLEKLIPLRPKLGIQSKSDLIVRDIDLLKQFVDCEVGLTITTLDEKLQQELEPTASSPERRIKALEELHQAGLKTYVFIGPILPLLTDWKKIILATKHCADFYMFENLNLSGGGVKSSVGAWLAACHPEWQTEYDKIYARGSDFWDKMETEIKEFCREHKIEARVYFHHGK